MKIQNYKCLKITNDWKLQMTQNNIWQMTNNAKYFFTQHDKGLKMIRDPEWHRTQKTNDSKSQMTQIHKWLKIKITWNGKWHKIIDN